jgi:hypothetical protein
MATLADALRGYTPPTESALADPIVEHFRTLPQQLATNQQAMDNTMASMYKTDMATGQPNPNYRPEAIQEFTQMMPAIMGSTNAVRMAKAMENAMLPIEKGGLGLPAGNTAAQRAKAMGYDIPVYHGTNADIEAFDVKGKGKTAGAGAFLTTNPITAETYVSASGGGNILPLLLKKDDFLTTNARGRNWSDIYTNQLAAKSGKTRYTPQELGLDINSATTTDELGMIANDLSKKGAEIKNVKDLGPNTHVMRAKEYLLEKYGIVPDDTWSNVTGKQWDESQKAMKKLYESQKSDIYAVQDPSLIRSKFAAFDPKKANSPDLLAGALAVPLADEDNRKAILEQLFNKQK